MSRAPILHLRAALVAMAGFLACSRSDPPPPRPSATAAPAPAPAPSPPPRPPQRSIGGGYLLDGDGTVHRAGEVRCTAGVHDRCRGTERKRSCKTDVDCKEHRGGACVHRDLDEEVVEGPAHDACSCVYTCVTDADCGPGEACVCEEAMAAASPDLRSKHLNGARCAPARCKSAADCGGRACDVSAWDDVCSFQVTLACRGDGDTCRSPSDCAAGENCGGRGPGCHEPQTCAFDGERWACAGIRCAH